MNVINVSTTDLADKPVFDTVGTEGIDLIFGNDQDNLIDAGRVVMTSSLAEKGMTLSLVVRVTMSFLVVMVLISCVVTWLRARCSGYGVAGCGSSV